MKKMKTVQVIAASLLALTLALPTLSQAGCGSCEGSHGKHEGSMMKHEGSHGKHEGSMTKHKGSHEKHKKGCHGSCPVMIPGADVNMKNSDNGVVITVTSANKETVKEIQKQAKKNLEKKTKMDKEMVNCPVMGTKMKRSQVFETAEYKGKTYHFCCAGCKPAFLKNPDKYVEK